MPKTFKHLYPQIYQFENLYQAFRQARRGGKRKKETVAAFRGDCQISCQFSCLQRIVKSPAR
jgi:hypothetical protein